MTMTNKQELQKTINIAREFIQRADDLIGEIEQADKTRAMSWPNRKFVSGMDSAAVRRQSMELTRQLAVLRKP